MVGTTIGPRNNANTVRPQRGPERATAIAAAPASSAVRGAVTAATPNERSVAVIQSEEPKYTCIQCRLKPGGGNSRKRELVKAIGTTINVGTIRKAIRTVA